MAEDSGAQEIGVRGTSIGCGGAVQEGQGLLGPVEFEFDPGLETKAQRVFRNDLEQSARRLDLGLAGRVLASGPAEPVEEAQSGSQGVGVVGGESSGEVGPPERLEVVGSLEGPAAFDRDPGEPLGVSSLEGGDQIVGLLDPVQADESHEAFGRPLDSIGVGCGDRFGGGQEVFHPALGLGQTVVNRGENELLDLSDRMRRVARMLEKHESGDPTQERQEEIVAILDELIKKHEQECSSCSGSGSGQGGTAACNASSEKP